MASRNKIDNLFRQGKPLVKRLKSVKPGESTTCPRNTISPAASTSNLDVAAASPLDLAAVTDVPTPSPPLALRVKTSMCLRRSSDKPAAGVSAKSTSKPAAKGPKKSSAKPVAKPAPKSVSKLIAKPSAKPSGKTSLRSSTKPVLRSSQRVLRQRRFNENALLVTDDPPLDASAPVASEAKVRPQLPRRSGRKTSSQQEAVAKSVKKDASDLATSTPSKLRKPSKIIISSSASSPVLPPSMFRTPPARRIIAAARTPRIPQRPDEPACEPSPALLPPSAVPIPITPTANTVVMSPPDLRPALLMSTVSSRLSHSPDQSPENRPSGVSIALFGNDGILGSDADNDDDDDDKDDEPCVVRPSRHVDASDDPLLSDILSLTEDLAK